TSAIGAIPDVVQHEVHGLLVPAHAPEAVADALQRLAEERTLLQRLAVAARSRIAQQYSGARLEAEFAALYAELARCDPHVAGLRFLKQRAIDFGHSLAKQRVTSLTLHILRPASGHLRRQRLVAQQLPDCGGEITHIHGNAQACTALGEYRLLIWLVIGD